ncbi:HER080Wp [Eremothecium sinecaudum]|uniref:Heat shock transcription factor n=1 Tax=Eremothecium sinecaudum TaxID=45286 RepID=A0A0X8HTT6_9SACH|nr:HER080Wp [Eremothecium sinecaudum]AMD21359.1 HER080Wp [Eremothecium sinecaudum]
MENHTTSIDEASPTERIINMNEVLSTAAPLKDSGDGGSVNERHTDDNGKLESNVPIIEDVINRSLDPSEILVPHSGNEEVEDDIGSAMMAPFSPILRHQQVSLNSTSTPGEHIFRRGTPLNLYSNATDVGTEHPATLHSTTTLLPYNLRSSKLLSNKPQQLLNRSSQQVNRSTPVNSPGCNAPAKKKLTTTKTKPAFINKLWSMVNDPVNQSLIHWSDDGKSFIVTQREQFVHEILPKYFKHSNFASFVRQLNMYGWHKVQDVKSGSIQSNSDDRWEFANENFIRGREDLLNKILRQKSNSTSKDGPYGMSVNSSGNNNLSGVLISNGDEVDITILITELETVKYNQMAIAEDLRRISKDNEMLWKENLLARERHQNQQQALEKIVKFLSSLYGSNTTRLLSDHLFHEQPTSAMNAQSAMGMPSMQMSEAAETQGTGTTDNSIMVPFSHRLRPRLLLKHRMTPASSSSSTAEWIMDSPSQDAAASAPPEPSPNAAKAARRIHEVNSDNSVHADVDHDSFFQDLQDNIDRQGESIQEIQDWIDKLSPKEVVLSGGSPENYRARFDPQEYLSAPIPQLSFTPTAIDDLSPVPSTNKRPLDDEVEDIPHISSVTASANKRLKDHQIDR